VKSRMLFAGLPLLVMLGAPSLARAATEVRVQDVSGQSVVVVVNDDGPEVIKAVLASDGMAVQAAGGAAPGADCEQGSDATIVTCTGTFDAIVAFGNGGNDSIDMKLIAPGVPPLHGEMAGGAGNDTLTVPLLNGDAQPSVYAEGNEGDDTIATAGGDDAVKGDAGNDSVSGGVGGADLVDGGPGTDSIPDGGGDYSRIFKGAVMSISLDGVANDGEAGEGDNVVGVEKITARGGAVTLTGDNGPNDFLVEAGTATLRGLGGNDHLVTWDGNDTIEGGDGDDFLEAGFGNDVLDGGPGVDQFNGDRNERDVFAIGNDEIRARDGNLEQIGCGIGGGDRAIVDANDVVASDCEAIERPPFAPPRKPEKPGKPKVPAKLSIRSILKKGLVIRISCPAACAVDGSLRVDKKTARKLKLGKSRVLARGKKSIAAAGTAKVKLKVVRKARKRFKRMRKAKVTLVTTTVIAGQATPSSRKLRLKR
jgi:RTX calcium-binding nonapeptide repeat (4 copies)